VPGYNPGFLMKQLRQGLIDSRINYVDGGRDKTWQMRTNNRLDYQHGIFYKCER
jgi:hypothetical protein